MEWLNYHHLLYFLLAICEVARNDVGEIRRVLNSFLQFLEQDTSASLIVGALPPAAPSRRQRRPAPLWTAVDPGSPPVRASAR